MIAEPASSYTAAGCALPEIIWEGISPGSWDRMRTCDLWVMRNEDSCG